jgi:hypothetical protein
VSLGGSRHVWLLIANVDTTDVESQVPAGQISDGLQTVR